MEVRFQLPWLDEGVFQQICVDLQVFSREFHSDGYRTLKPYSHETTLQVIFSVASGLILAEFFRAFFKQWGTKTAAICDELFQKHRKHGLKEICISGTFHPRQKGDGVKFNFDVKASSKEEVFKGMEYIEKELIAALESKKLTSDFVKETGDWRIVVWRV